ncbi:hypothetical protein [Roseibium sp.]|uniref:hypothetical protein n=1 Tax=Roseibium sp. TaxID=1936156 RepID=UPI003BAA1B09
MLTRRSSRSRGHRDFLRPIIGIFAALLVASCGPAGTNYLTEGIGSNLATSEADIATTSNLQNRYFAYLCQQAGLAASVSSYASSTCHLHPINDPKWLIVVAQGMNDIDRRCDAYLQWLDNQKRSRGPIQSQIGSIRAATTGIMGVADASATALTVAGLAFDLISKSVENYHSRLLLEVESSTVNSIVLNTRRKFRADFRTNRIQVTDRPQAEFVLRSYLRLCLPFAIEANINNYSTLGSSGIAPTPENSINWSPQSGLTIGAAGGGVERTFTARAPVTVDPGLSDEQRISGAVTPWEEQIQEADLTTVQQFLCISSPANNFGDRTRAGILLWSQSSFRDGDISTELNRRSGPAILDQARNNACNTSNYKNYYERFRFADDAAAEATFVQKVLEMSGSSDTSKTRINEIRELIIALKDSNAFESVDLSMTGVSKDEVTPTFYKLVSD